MQLSHFEVLEDSPTRLLVRLAAPGPDALQACLDNPANPFRQALVAKGWAPQRPGAPTANLHLEHGHQPCLDTTQDPPQVFVTYGLHLPSDPRCRCTRVGEPELAKS